MEENVDGGDDEAAAGDDLEQLPLCDSTDFFPTPTNSLLLLLPTLHRRIGGAAGLEKYRHPETR